MTTRDPILAHLGSVATDPNGQKYRLVIGEQSVSEYSVAYEVGSRTAIPDGTVLTIEGWGTWTYAIGLDRGDGWHYGSIS